MASTTAQIRAALAAAIKAGITGWQVSPYMLALPIAPAIDIRPSGTIFDRAMARGSDDLSYMIRAMVAFNNDQGAQIRLDTLIDATASTGMKTVLETDKTLGAVVGDVRVVSVSDYKALIVEGQPPLLAVEFLTMVYP